MAFGFISDIFSQDQAQGYKPNKSNFEYGQPTSNGGQAGGGFYKKAEAAYGQQGPQADLTNAYQSRGLGLKARAQLDSELSALGARRGDQKLSQAYQQLQQGQSENERRALALARSGGGGGAGQASALRAAQFSNAQGAQQTNQAAGIQRAAEIAEIDRQVIAGRAQQRAMDLQAQGLDAQTAMQQAQLELAQRGLNTQRELGLYGLSQNAELAQQRGLMGYEALLGGGANAANLANAGFDAQRDAGLAGLLGTIGAAGIIASDLRAKTDVMDAAAMTPQSVRPPEQPQPGLGTQLGQAQGIGSMLGGLGGGGSAPMVNPASLWATPDQIAMSDEHSKEQIASLTALNKYLTGALQDVTSPKPVARPALAPSQNKEYADAFARHEAARRAAVGDMIAQARDDQRRERLVAAARGTGPQPDVITENPKIGEVARDFSEPLSEAEQRRLMLNGLKSAGVLRPAEAGPVSSEEQQTALAPVTSDKEAKRDARELGRIEGQAMAAIDAARGGRQPEYPSVPTKSFALPGVSQLRRPAGEMARPDVRQPDIGALDRAHGSPIVEGMASIPSYSWRYKPEMAPEANARMGLPPDHPYGFERKVGPMAQDLERNPLTAGAVATGPDGMKRVDAGQLAMTTTAGLADLARFAEDQEARLKKLEASRSRVPYPKAGGAR